MFVLNSVINCLLMFYKYFNICHVFIVFCSFISQFVLVICTFSDNLEGLIFYSKDYLYNFCNTLNILFL